jgi:hypothetical protein
VDWFGLDVFDADHFDQSLPDTLRGEITRKGKSERFLGMARTKQRPVYLNETSAKGVNITADSIDSQNDWNAWYGKFWAFMDAHVEIKGFNYINQDWEHTGYPGWGDARIQNSPYITSWYRQEMRRSKYVHLHSSVTSVKADPLVPEAYALDQNYPNPFNPSTVIRYSIPSVAAAGKSPTRVTLKVYNVLGQEVANLVDGVEGSGEMTVNFEANNLASGVYIYRLTGGTFAAARKMVLLR